MFRACLRLQKKSTSYTKTRRRIPYRKNKNNVRPEQPFLVEMKQSHHNRKVMNPFKNSTLKLFNLEFVENRILFNWKSAMPRYAKDLYDSLCMNRLFWRTIWQCFREKLPLECLFGRCLAGAVNHESEGKILFVSLCDVWCRDHSWNSNEIYPQAFYSNLQPK